MGPCHIAPGLFGTSETHAFMTLFGLPRGQQLYTHSDLHLCGSENGVP